MSEMALDPKGKLGRYSTRQNQKLARQCEQASGIYTSGGTDHTDMTIAVDWDVKHQTKRTKTYLGYILKQVNVTRKYQIHRHIYSQYTVYFMQL